MPFLIPIAAGAAASAAVTAAGITFVSSTVASVVVGAIAGALVAESEGGDWKMGAVTGALGGWTGGSLVSSFSAAGEGAASQALAEEAAAAGTSMEPIATEAGITSEMVGVAPAKDVGVIGTREAASQALAPSAVQTMQVPAKPGLTSTSGKLAGQATTSPGIAGGGQSGVLAGGYGGESSALAGLKADAAKMGSSGTAGTSGIESAMRENTKAIIGQGRDTSAALVKSSEIQSNSAKYAADKAAASQDTALKFQMLGSMMEGMAADEEGKAAQSRWEQQFAYQQEYDKSRRISLTPTAAAPTPTPLNLRNPGVVYDWQKQPNPQTLYRV